MSHRQFEDALNVTLASGEQVDFDFDYWLYVVERDESGELKVLAISNVVRRAALFALRGEPWRHAAERNDSEAPWNNRTKQPPQSEPWFCRITMVDENCFQHVSRFDAMLCHEPELIAHAPIADRSAARLPGPVADGFKQRITRACDANRKQNLDRRIEKIFLQQVNNPIFHLSPEPAPIPGN
jgi:hypothetical protein